MAGSHNPAFNSGKNFNLIAVEGDWPAMYEVNRYIQGTQNAANVTAFLHDLQRWPAGLSDSYLNNSTSF